MAAQQHTNAPLVSVIIPCYNHAHYLPHAIRSVQQQSYSPIEIIVVNDGSSDNTAEVAAQFPVKYIYQDNGGLSAARNKGIANSNGEYLVFLDADDWLYKDAVSVNVAQLQGNEQAMFVSGEHDKVFEDGRETETSNAGEHFTPGYASLLKGNYIGMHAAVMYRRKVFDEFQYDDALPACEDYDLYLKIARKYPVLHHGERMAAYRRHSNNMSGDTSFMLATVLGVLQRQQPLLQTPEEQQAYREGVQIWNDYYNPVTNYKTSSLKQLIKKYAPASLLRWLHRTGRYKNYVPAPGRVNAGDLKRLTPFSTQFGYDRGGPVDRYYIERFLAAQSGSIKGRVLEIGDAHYTKTYGAGRVQQSDVLHVDETNPHATFVGDLTDGNLLPADSFDCIILTQTLHLIYDYHTALKNCHRALKPGGTLLMTVPGITPIDHGEWKRTWYWSFTEAAVTKMLGHFAKADITTNGNVFATTAFLYGMGLPEVDKKMLDRTDIHYPVIITAAATK